MRFVCREPGIGYIDRYLWLPRNYYSALGMDRALRYSDARTGEMVSAWATQRHHYLVPRNYYTAEDLARVKFPVIDARFTDFPEVKFDSKITLDKQDPSKDFQRKGSAALLGSDLDAILTLRCGAGKTVTGLHTASQLNQPILVVVDEKSLAVQWRESIADLLGVPESGIGTYAGTKDDWEHPITIAMVQTLARRAHDHKLPEEMTRHFGVVLFDEAHCMGAPYFNLAAPRFHGKRWGLSATPHREDGFDSLLRYTMGRVVFSYLTPDTIPTFYFEPGGGTYPSTSEGMKEITAGRKVHHGLLYGHLAGQANRLSRIQRVVEAKLKEGREILILSNSRKMVENLAKVLEEHSPGVAHGGINNPEQRRRNIQDCNPVLATMRIGKQALDKAELDTLILCDPVTKDSVLQQIMGRILRLRAGKRDPEVIVFEDHEIKESAVSCHNIRRTLSRWPKHKGGAIPYVTRRYQTRQARQSAKLTRKVTKP